MIALLLLHHIVYHVAVLQVVAVISTVEYIKTTCKSFAQQACNANAVPIQLSQTTTNTTNLAAYEESV
jgi:hypothetical protein